MRIVTGSESHARRIAVLVPLAAALAAWSEKTHDWKLCKGTSKLDRQKLAKSNFFAPWCS
jgi:hypothetical protein